MNYEIFRQKFSDTSYIRLSEILLHFPKIDRKQLSRWVKKGLLIHIARSVYALGDCKRDASWKMMVAGEIVDPSYISLEFALSYYSLIPEEVVVITSVTTKKTQSYDLGEYGRYSYRSIVSRAFIGYGIMNTSKGVYLMANRAKAIVDFLYFHSDYTTNDDFDEWRINIFEVRENLSPKDLRAVGSIFHNKRLEAQVESFISYIWSE